MQLSSYIKLQCTLVMEVMALFHHKNVVIIVIFYACGKRPLGSSFIKFVEVLAFVLQKVALS